MPQGNCPFCAKSFSRQDAARRHSIKCLRRAGQPLPETRIVRGRKRHACVRCVQKKLFCDGSQPCTACSTKDAACVQSSSGNSHGQRTTASQLHETDAATYFPVAFILCDGEDELFSRFKFPRSPRGSMSGEPEDLYLDLHYGCPSPIEADDISLQLASWFDLDCVTGPFDYGALTEDSSEWQNDSLLTCAAGDPFNLLQSSTRLTNIREAILRTLGARNTLDRSQHNVERSLQHMFLPDQVNRSLALYFDGWHQICRIVHRPTFSVKNTPDALLVAMVFLGAMYDPNERDRERAAEAIDSAENYVFAQLDKIGEFVSSPWSDRQDHAICTDDENSCFHLLQAGFLMVVAQKWAGSTKSKQRAASFRFSKVVEMTRKQGLLGVTHTLEDRSSQCKWLAVECRIRTSAWITLLDCALLFFWGRTARIVTTEIQCDLPCDEDVFEEQDPFTHPHFTFRRTITSETAFQALFSDVRAQDLHLTMLDTFIVIHLLYRAANDVLTVHLCLGGGFLQSNMRSRLRAALDSWHSKWTQLRSAAMENDSWNRLGFWKHGDQYECAIRLLISEKAKPHLAQLLEVDVGRLERLRSLNG